MCADSTYPLLRLYLSLWPDCLWRPWRVGKEVSELLLLSSGLAASQASHVSCRRTVINWPASLGLRSGPAGSTMEGRPACFARRARGPTAGPAARGVEHLTCGSQRKGRRHGRASVRLPDSRRFCPAGPVTISVQGSSSCAVCITPVLRLCYCFRAIGCFATDIHY